MDKLALDILDQAKLTPYFHLNGYMDRFWLTPDPKGSTTQKLSARVHVIHRADVDDHMHDHPAESISIILDSGYIERVPLDQDQDPSLDSHYYVDHFRNPGDVVYRRAQDRHKIVRLLNGPCTTVFCMGPKEQEWGFYTPQGKVHWRAYLNDWGADPEPGSVAGIVRPEKTAGENAA